jgi:hypothetical protein
MSFESMFFIKLLQAFESPIRGIRFSSGLLKPPASLNIVQSIVRRLSIQAQLILNEASIRRTTLLFSEHYAALSVNFPYGS